MKSVIVCSLNDPAGTNIRERFIELFDFRETDEWFDSYPVYGKEEIKIICSHKDIVFVDDVEKQFGKANYYFISRHRAESGQPSLTAHFTGNFGPNAFGGKPQEIAAYNPSLLKNYLLQLKSLRDKTPGQYAVTMEATHHGPTSLESPVLFVELGSTNEQWLDTGAAKSVAEALLGTIGNANTYEKCAIGIGGTHYPEKFNNLLLETDIALGPVVPKYSLQFFTGEILQQILAKSTQEIKLAAVDNKGLGQYKEKVMSVLRSSSLEQMRA